MVLVTWPKAIINMDKASIAQKLPADRSCKHVNRVGLRFTRQSSHFCSIGGECDWRYWLRKIHAKPNCRESNLSFCLFYHLTVCAIVCPFVSIGSLDPFSLTKLSSTLTNALWFKKLLGAQWNSKVSSNQSVRFATFCLVRACALLKIPYCYM